MGAPTPFPSMEGGLRPPMCADTKKPTDASYISLIQQYLSVLCYDNATFLAERFLAHSPSRPHAIYLLGMCHYRSGSPKRAKSVLEKCQQKLPKTKLRGDASDNHGSQSTDNDKKGRNNEMDENDEWWVISSIHYLLAKCCFELKLYAQAEDALLEICRAQFRSLSGGNMDQFILTTTPCPIPNGAAGLHLLGHICRKSNKKQRAQDYFRMSLKLDPFLWTSFEALCEMGASGGDNAIDNPVDVFGVHPVEVTMGALGMGMGMGMAPLDEKENLLREGDTTTPIATTAIEERPRNSSKHQPQAQPDIFGTPSIAEANDSHCGFPAMSLFSSGGPSRLTNASAQGPGLDTPGLTPIQNDQTTNSFLAYPSNSNNQSILHNQPHRSTTLQQDERLGLSNENPHNISGGGIIAVDRAKQVAARLYYEPSPEMTPPTSIRENISFDEPSNVCPRRNRKYRLSGLVIARSRLFEPSPALMGDTESSLHDQSHSTVVSSTPLPPRVPVPTVPQQMQHGSGDDDALLHDEDSDEIGGVQAILELLCVLGAAQKQLCLYHSREALQIFNQLPHEQYQTGWVLHQVGRAYFEMADYKNAKIALETMQFVEPYRLKGIEVLSTALWHLKKEVELSHLAQKAVDFDRMSPEAWCVVGNCFSLQNEHETALNFFRRSIQLDSSFTYSHTLSGHEYVSNEDFDKAINCFRDAIRANDRHYNAWYGLGAIYFRQEKYDLAEYHFHRALSINPQSSVLHCHLGMAQHANHKPYEALETLKDAFVLDPRNPQARYQRATIYMSLDRPQEALEELKRVRDAAPRESSVHFAMGRVLKRMNQIEEAMRCFLTALDLDPKDNNLIKAALDKLDQPDVEEDGSAF